MLHSRMGIFTATLLALTELSFVTSSSLETLPSSRRRRRSVHSVSRSSAQIESGDLSHISLQLGKLDEHRSSGKIEQKRAVTASETRKTDEAKQTKQMAKGLDAEKNKRKKKDKEGLDAEKDKRKKKDKDKPKEKEKEDKPKKKEKHNARSWLSARSKCEICLSLVMVLLLVVVIDNFGGQPRQARKNSEARARLVENTKASGTHMAQGDLPENESSMSLHSMGDTEVVKDSCDYVMVFPLRGKNPSNRHFSGTRMMHLHWEKQVNAFEKACAIFQDPSKPRLVETDILIRRFPVSMTFEDYSNEVCKLLVELLRGPNFGCKLHTFPSIDHEEVFLKISLPRDDEVLKQYAISFAYILPLSDTAYEGLNQPVPKDSDGVEMRAHTPFVHSRDTYFAKFRQVDRMRLLRARIDKYIDLSELMKQDIVAEHFPPHNWSEVSKMYEGVADLKVWYRIPDKNNEDSIRDYFGEETAWMFVWQACYARALLIPACLGAVLYFRRFVFEVEYQRYVQLGFAFIMGLWATLYNGFYKRYEARVRQRWGMDKFVPPIQVRNEYDPDLEHSWTPLIAALIGDILAFIMLGVVVVGVYFIQIWREWMLDQENHSWIWPKIAALLVSVQILTIDKAWVVVSQVVVNAENHKSQSQWNASWVRKVFVVRIFNNLFPFIYVGFIKQYTHESCPGGEYGCLQELQLNLVVYFVIRICSQLAADMFDLAVMEVQVFAELRKWQSRAKVLTYLQIQAKSLEYDDATRLDDWTEQLMTFAFLACFNVVLPAIAPVAFLMSLLQSRCMAHRNMCYLRRPIPTGSVGIGEWQNLFEVVEVIAVIINVSFAVFALKPIRELDTNVKWVIFISVEHLLMIIRTLVRAKFPSEPHDVEALKHLHEETIRKRFVDLDTHPVIAKETSEVTDIGPKAFGGRMD